MPINKGLLILILIGTIASGIGLAMSVRNIQVAESELELANKDVAYEYGMCVFYYEISVEQCNEGSNQKGLAEYEKYYGDGSWTVEADPIP